MEYKLELGFTSHHCKTKLKLVLHAKSRMNYKNSSGSDSSIL